jgi:C2 domain
MAVRFPLFAGAFLSVACGAVYPEIAPPVKAPPPGRDVAPPSPSDMLYLTFTSAEIPSQTRDGRQWDSVGGSLPDPFAKLFIDDREIIRTPIQANTLTPTWPDQRRANYRVPAGARVRIEVWDSNPINNHPICLKKLHDLHELAGPEPIEVDCDSGAHVRLRAEAAHARWGLGFYYELRTETIAISHVLKESPGGRAGLVPGEEIVEIEGKRVKGMEAGEAQSLVNSNAQIGIDLLLKDPTGKERNVKVKEGPIYPTIEDGIPLE